MQCVLSLKIHLSPPLMSCMRTARGSAEVTHLWAGWALEILPRQNHRVSFQLVVFQKPQDELGSRWLLQLPGAQVSNRNEVKGDGSRPGYQLLSSPLTARTFCASDVRRQAGQITCRQFKLKFLVPVLTIQSSLPLQLQASSDSSHLQLTPRLWPREVSHLHKKHTGWMGHSTAADSKGR